MAQRPASRSGNDELEFLVGLSLAAAVAMENARLFAEAQQRAAELDTVNTVSQQLAGKLDVDALIDLVGEQIRRSSRPTSPMSRCSIATTDIIDFPFQHGDDLGSRPTARADQQDHRDRRGAASSTATSTAGPRRCGTKRVGKEAHSYLGVPIIVDGRAEGVISVQSTDARGRL